VVSAGPGYPITEITSKERRLRVRVPNGDDQQAIAHLDDEQALRTLLKRCIVSATPESSLDTLVDALTDAEVAAIDAALDAVSPAIGTATSTRCPECDAEQRIKLDPYRLAEHALPGLYRDLHHLAIWYHWSERDILALPRDRRRMYLQLIDQTRGMHG
jgi:hypothetical protein